MDGVAWTAKARIPIDPTNSTVDHFIPGFAVDRSTSGNSTRLALGYYYYPVANCSSDLSTDRRLRLVHRRRGHVDATAQGGRGRVSTDLDREHEPGRDGRRLYVDVVRRRQLRVPDLRRRQGQDGWNIIDERMYGAQVETSRNRPRAARAGAQRTASDSRSTTSSPTSSFHRSPEITLELIDVGSVGEKVRRARSVWTAVAVRGGAQCALRRGRLRGQRDSDADQRRPVHGDGGSQHQHKTQVEPDSFAFGQTIVALTQSGRWFSGGGSSNLVFSLVAERRTDVDDRRPARNDHQLRRPMAAHQ